MKQELRTMAEKQKQDPNELMENGLTRKENEDRAAQDAGFSIFVNLILVVISLFCMFTALQGLL